MSSFLRVTQQPGWVSYGDILIDSKCQSRALIPNQETRYSPGNCQGSPWSSLPSHRTARWESQGLGSAFVEWGQRLQNLYPSPSPTAISGYGGGIIWCQTRLFTPLLFCYVLLPTPPISCSCLLAWVPLALETQAELAGGLTSLDVWTCANPSKIDPLPLPAGWAGTARLKQATQ